MNDTCLVIEDEPEAYGSKLILSRQNKEAPVEKKLVRVSNPQFKF
jgi:hypothetical protein